MPFQKGKSGNPGGRKPIPRSVVEAAQAASLEAVKVLSEIMSDAGAPAAARVSAAERILDRAYGKPAQTLNANITSNVQELSEAELDRRIAAALAGEASAASAQGFTH